MSEPFTLFKNIKKARVSSGLSQKDLAEGLGVSDKTVSAYETGRAIPSATMVTKIADLTGSPISDILGAKNGDNQADIAKRLQNIEHHLSSREIKPKIKIDAFVGVVLLDNKNRIFLIKEEDKYRIAMGRWNLPGGSVDGNESLVDSAERETKEETGHDSKVSSLLGVYKCKKGDNSWIYTVFKADLVHNGEGKTDPEVKEGKWFTKEEFLKLEQSRIVHSDMKLVYKIAIENRGLGVESVKYIDYDAQ